MKKGLGLAVPSIEPLCQDRPPREMQIDTLFMRISHGWIYGRARVVWVQLGQYVVSRQSTQGWLRP